MRPGGCVKAQTCVLVRRCLSLLRVLVRRSLSLLPTRHDINVVSHGHGRDLYLFGIGILSG